MRGGCGPPCSFELNQALRHARSATAKGRRAAACWSTRDAPMWSDARGGCGLLCSFELNQARRSARSGTAKGRDAAASCATRDAPRWSDARRLWADVQL